MTIRWKPVSKILCAVAALIGAALFVPGTVALIYHEYDCLKVFLLCAGIYLVAGLSGLYLIPATSNTTLRMKDGFFAVGTAWVLMSVLGCLPFVFTGAIPHFADALFETASGFSTTGSTILSEIESLPRSVLFWRALTHWLGGMGVLVLTVAVLPMIGIGGQKLMRAETTGPTMDRISFKLSDAAKGLYAIYIGMTALETVLLLLGGMDFYDAITHSFSTAGTGGFSSYNASVGAFNSVYIEMVIALFMFLFGINFNLYYGAVKGDLKTLFHDAELRTYAAIVFGSIGFISVMLKVSGTYASFGKGLRDAIFQVTSLISTTGFATADYELWPIPCRIVVFFLLLVGGCASSTSGGLKVIRVMLFGKLIRRGFFRKLHPTSVTPVKLGGRSVSPLVMSQLAAYLLVYTGTVIVSSVLLSFENVTLLTALSSVVTCLSNIGPGFEMVGPTCNFGFYSDASKYLLSFLMITGRLELYTVLVMLCPQFWNRRS